MSARSCHLFWFIKGSFLVSPHWWCNKNTLHNCFFWHERYWRKPVEANGAITFLRRYLPARLTFITQKAASVCLTGWLPPWFDVMVAHDVCRRVVSGRHWSCPALNTFSLSFFLCILAANMGMMGARGLFKNLSCVHASGPRPWLETSGGDADIWEASSLRAVTSFLFIFSAPPTILQPPFVH